METATDIVDSWASEDEIGEPFVTVIRDDPREA